MIGDANLFFFEKDAGHAEINLMIAKVLQTLNPSIHQGYTTYPEIIRLISAWSAL